MANAFSRVRPGRNVRQVKDALAAIFPELPEQVGRCSGSSRLTYLANLSYLAYPYQGMK
jgi:hypothetical protein